LFMETFVLILYLAVLFSLSAWYLKRRYHRTETYSVKLIADETKLTTVLLLAYIAVLVMNIVYHNRTETGDAVLKLAKWNTIYCGTLLIAIIDKRERKIPNELILTLLCLRAVLLVIEVLVVSDQFKIVVLYPLIGAVIASMIILAAMIVSKNGVGMGDVKLYFAIGLYVGSTNIMAVLFYSIVASALFGAFLLITKKAGLKDYMPMAPFAFFGLAVKYFLLLIGG